MPSRLPTVGTNRIHKASKTAIVLVVVKQGAVKKLRSLAPAVLAKTLLPTKVPAKPTNPAIWASLPRREATKSPPNKRRRPKARRKLARVARRNRAKKAKEKP